MRNLDQLCKNKNSMKKYITLLLVSFTSLVSAQIADRAENISPLLIGEKIPNVVLEDSNGKEINTYQILKKKIYLPKT